MKKPESSASRTGWGVVIFRKDGTNFLGSSGTGDIGAVWAKCNRKWAVAHKRELIAHGFKAEVVPVRYSISYGLPKKVKRT